MERELAFWAGLCQSAGVRKAFILFIFLGVGAVPNILQAEPAFQYRKGKEAADQKFYQNVKPLIEKFLKGIEKKNSAEWDGLCDPGLGFLFRLLGFYNTPLKCDEFAALYQDKKERWWGRADGTDDPITGTFKKTWHGHLSDVAKKHDTVGVNVFVQTGNAPNQTMGQAPFVDLTWKGSKKHGRSEEDGGMDWLSVRLFFTQKNGKLVLQGMDLYHWVI